MTYTAKVEPNCTKGDHGNCSRSMLCACPCHSGSAGSVPVAQGVAHCFCGRWATHLCLLDGDGQPIRNYACDEHGAEREW